MNIILSFTSYCTALLSFLSLLTIPDAVLIATTTTTTTTIIL